MKGINPLLSHTLTVLMSLLLLVIVIVAMNSITDENKKFFAEKEMLVTCRIMQSSIEEVYLPYSDYVSPNNFTLNTVKVTLPKALAGSSYRGNFDNKTLFLETQGQPKINMTCKIGFNLSYSGVVRGGRTEIQLFSYSNSSKEIKVLGA